MASNILEHYTPIARDEKPKTAHQIENMTIPISKVMYPRRWAFFSASGESNKAALSGSCAIAIAFARALVLLLTKVVNPAITVRMLPAKRGNGVRYLFYRIPSSY